MRVPVAGRVMAGDWMVVTPPSMSKSPAPAPGRGAGDQVVGGAEGARSAWCRWSWWAAERRAATGPWWPCRCHSGWGPAQVGLEVVEEDRDRARRRHGEGHAGGAGERAAHALDLEGGRCRWPPCRIRTRSACWWRCRWPAASPRTGREAAGHAAGQARAGERDGAVEAVRRGHGAGARGGCRPGRP